MRLNVMLIGFIAVMVVSTFLSPSALAADPFEGTNWKIKVTPAADSDSPNDKTFDDTLKFKGSKFSSARFVKEGFEPSDFDQRSNRGPMAGFSVTQKNDAAGSVEW